MQEDNEEFKEVELLKNFNHPNIIKIIEHFYLKGKLYIIMEYAENGSLVDPKNYSASPD